MLKFVMAMAGVAALASGAAAADEAWMTEVGQVIYDHDTPAGDAVLTYPTGAPGVRGIAYIHDLAGQTTGRRDYKGVWIEPDGSGAPACRTAIVDPETGEMRQTWGQVQLIFVKPDFPSSWVFRRGYCFGELGEYLVGRPFGGK